MKRCPGGLVYSLLALCLLLGVVPVWAQPVGLQADAPPHMPVAADYATLPRAYVATPQASGPGAAEADRSPVAISAPHMIYLPLIVRNYYSPPVYDCEDLIENGSFEANAAWHIGNTPRPARYTALRAHTGSRSMLLGIRPGRPDVRSYSSVRQAITLPADLDHATLTYWYYPVSDSDPGDRQECLLLDENDSLLAILMRTNVNTRAWTEMSYDLSAYAGQTIKVYFNAYNDNDGSGVTSFFLDDVVVEACRRAGPPPTVVPPTPPPGCYPSLLATVGVGDAPHGVAVNSAVNRVYVANHKANTLTVVNGATYHVVATANVGNGPNGVAYNATTDRIYVANRNGNSVTVLRGSDYGLVKTIPVGLQPDGLAVDETARRLYVANHLSGSVSVINVSTNAVLHTVSVGTNAEPAMVAVNTTTHKAYVALHGAGKVAVVDGAGSMSKVDIYSTGPYGIAVDEVRNLVYVATINTARIAVIDGSTDSFLGWAEIKRLPGGQRIPLRMIAVNPLIGTSGHIYVTSAGVDDGTNQVLLLPKGWDEYFARPHGLSLNEPREGIAFDPATLRVWVTSRADDLVAAYMDGEPMCAPQALISCGYEGDYQVTVCVAGPAGTCQETYTRPEGPGTR